MRTFAVDIGGTKFSVCLFEDDKMIARESRATDRTGGKDWMIEQICSIGECWRGSAEFDRCGIGFGGPVDFRAQKVALSTHVEGWSNVDLAGILRERLRVPVIIDNDANVGALGEYRFGAGVGCDPLFYMTLSTGIGGGIVTEGRVLRGPDSYAGEIGHIAIDPAGPSCLCGAHGCFERMCCGLWLERDFGKPAKELLSDPSFVSEYVKRLASGLKIAIMLLNPARIVIGGGISKAGEALFGPLREDLRRQVTAWSRARLDVQPAKLGDDSVLYGALVLAGRS